MGGHAFKNLYCPRINPNVYCKIKAQATAALQTVFAHVVVPTEMPEKNDYGDVDFLVCSPLHYPQPHTLNDFPWEETVQLIKDAFKTTHGRRGYLTNDCMYFAVDAPCDGKDHFIQIDVKVCLKPELFEWYSFKLGYASNSKIIGSMVKPLGLTIDPEGIHIRVEDLEEMDHNGSMVWISKDPKDILRITGLDFRIVNAGFITKEEIYKYLISSWLFNPAHFAARLAEENYQDRLEERSAPWTHFIKEWVPEHYPGYCFTTGSPDTVKPEDGSKKNSAQDLQAWYKHTRSAVRDKVFTMFPSTAEQYYAKRAAHIKKLEEQRLVNLIMNAIPMDTERWEISIASVNLTFTHVPPTPPGLQPMASHKILQPLLDFSIVNYVGMWRGRLEKESKKSAKGGEEEKDGDRLGRIRERLEVVNKKLGFLVA
ncbi:hypothetical protein J3E72DRAFT_186765 [Bipolaris maydis]|nr:hypothetical protein J3E74DRAFT_207823 [Bipolaris maydis]KAJ6199647.1 hypothetical protein J3E72DRAFT_186765 [Bipolaris maydis]